MIERKSLLEKLVGFDAKLAIILPLLRQFGWDSDKTLVILQREDIVSVLDRYLKSVLSASDIEQWANAIEGREDIEYEAGHGSTISAAIHELANPILTASLTIKNAKKLIGQLQQ